MLESRKLQSNEYEQLVFRIILDGIRGLNGRFLLAPLQQALIILVTFIQLLNFYTVVLQRIHLRRYFR